MKEKEKRKPGRPKGTTGIKKKVSEKVPKAPKKPRKQPKHYVNNAKFTEAVSDYVTKYKEAKKNNTTLPIMNDYIGDCLLKIATRLSLRPNFFGYSFREEMVFDGLENSLMYSHNFNPEKSSNAFSYFTQIIYFAFLRRIQSEKKQLYIRYKQTKNMREISDNSVIESYDHNTYPVESFYNDDYDQTMTTFIENFENSQKEKKLKTRERNKHKQTESKDIVDIMQLLGISEEEYDNKNC